MTRLVVCGPPPVRVAQHDLARSAEDDLLQRVGEVAHRDLLVLATRCQQRGLVYEVGQVRADHPDRRRGEPAEIDVRGERNRAGMHAQDLLAPYLVGGLHRDAPVEAAGAQQCGIEDVRPVRRGEHDHAGRGVEAVHLREDLVQRLLALVVPAAECTTGATRSSDRVDLVDEHDRGRRGLRLGEQVAHARGADADDHLDELRGGHREERHAGLPGHRAREQGLARPRRAAQEHAARDPRAELRVLRRVTEEVDDLRELLLGLLDASDVVEGHALGRRLVLPRLRTTESEHAAARSAGAAQVPEPEAEEEQRRPEVHENALPQRSLADRRLGGDLDAMLLHQLVELRPIRELWDLRREARRADCLLVRVADVLLEPALDPQALRGNRRDVAVAELRDERRSIRNLDARICRRPEEQRHDHVVHEQQAEEDADVAPAEALRSLPAFLSLGLGSPGAILRSHVHLLLVSMHGSLAGEAAISLPLSARWLPLRRRRSGSAATCRAAARGSDERPAGSCMAVRAHIVLAMTTAIAFGRS